MRTLNQAEIASVNGGLSITDVVNALNGKPNTSIFASTETKVITLAISLAAPYLKTLFNNLVTSLTKPKTT